MALPSHGKELTCPLLMHIMFITVIVMNRTTGCNSSLRHQYTLDSCYPWSRWHNGWHCIYMALSWHVPRRCASAVSSSSSAWMECAAATTAIVSIYLKWPTWMSTLTWVAIHRRKVSTQMNTALLGPDRVILESTYTSMTGLTQRCDSILYSEVCSYISEIADDSDIATSILA